MKKFYTFCYTIFIVINANSQAVIEWQNTIGGSDNDIPYSICQNNDGGFIIGGYSKSNMSGDKTENCKGSLDYWIVKTDSFGNFLWDKTIGGSATDQLYSIQQTTDGGYILGGLSYSGISGDKTENSNGEYDYWIVKTDAIGNIEWQNTIGGSGFDYLRSIHQTSDGGYILGGFSNSNISGDKTENTNGLDDYWIVKTDALGNIQWQNTIGGSGNDHLLSIQQTADGGYLLNGSSESNISGDKTENSNGGYDYWIVKTNALGNIEWQKTIGGSGNDNQSLENFTNVGYLIGGSSESNISGDKTENSNGGYDYWIVKLDISGNIQWQNTIGGSGIDYLRSIHQTSDGGYVLAGSSGSNISGDKTENNKGGGDYWIVKIDSSGYIQWQKTIGGSNGEECYSVRQTFDGEYVIAGYSLSNISGDKLENCIGWYDFWIVKLTTNFNSITGNSFIDLNNNTLQDIGENSIINKTIIENISGRIAITDVNGYYSLSVIDTGNFSVLSSSLAYYTPVPANHTAYFSGINQIDSLNDFAFQPNGVMNDLQVTINPVGAFRPGFNAFYNIHYKNVGTVPSPATIIFYPDTNLTFVTSIPSPTSVVSDSVVWNIQTLNPFDEGNILVTVNVDANTPLGIWINSQAGVEPITGDANLLDNIASWRIETTGSFDPNDILVNRETVTTTELITPPYLDYLIRFQNTGTDTAFTVKIKNPLPINGQLNTFEFLESSHPLQLNYSNEEQLMWFQFDNILLPDSNSNELLSHGYVRYRIKPQSTLVVGDLIENSASIFFDFNAPVITNTAVTEIVLPTYVPGVKNNFDFSIFPNPSTGEVNISFNLKEEKEIKIELFNSLGQLVKTISQQKFTAGKNQINFTTENLSKGIYHIKFSVDDNVVIRKLVKM